MKKLTVAKLALKRASSGRTIGLSDRHIFEILYVHIWDTVLIADESDRQEMAEAHQAIRDNVRGVPRPKCERTDEDGNVWQAIDAFEQAVEWTNAFTKRTLTVKSKTLNDPKATAGRMSAFVGRYLKFIDNVSSYKKGSRQHALATYMGLIE